MSYLSKLTVKTVKRNSAKDPKLQRRLKLVAGIDEQLKVAADTCSAGTGTRRCKM